MSHRACWIGIMAVSFLVLTAFSGLTARVVMGSPEDLFSGVTTLLTPYSAHPTVHVDGVIAQNEYNPDTLWTTPDTGISISLIHDNSSIYVGIDGPAWSWIALGISSDLASSMGFVVIARSGSGYDVQEYIVNSVSEEMVLSPPGGHLPENAVMESEATLNGNHSVAELQLSLDSSLWVLQPGVVYPTVVASNLTAASGFPAGLSGSEVHFMGSYLLRQEDSVRNVKTLLDGEISPIPGLLAVAVLGAGVLLILIEFVFRRRKE
jgi:hypothetical protein